MPPHVTFQKLQPGQEDEACALVIRGFTEFIAPDYTPSGISTFLEMATPEELGKLAQAKGQFILTAAQDGKIIGLIAIKSTNHIALLFVDRDQRGQGLGRELIHQATERCLLFRPKVRKITVSAAPAAVAYYRRLGFVKTAPEIDFNGMRFTSMTKVLT